MAAYNSLRGNLISSMLQLPMVGNDESIRKLLISGTALSNFGLYYRSSVLDTIKSFGECRRLMRRRSKSKAALVMDVIGDGPNCVGFIATTFAENDDLHDVSLVITLAPTHTDVGCDAIKTFLGMLQTIGIRTEITRAKVLLPVSETSGAIKEKTLENLLTSCGFIVENHSNGEKTCIVDIAQRLRQNADCFSSLLVNAPSQFPPQCNASSFDDSRSGAPGVAKDKSEMERLSQAFVTRSMADDWRGREANYDRRKSRPQRNLLGSIAEDTGRGNFSRGRAEKDAGVENARKYSAHPRPGSSGRICPWFARGLCRFGDRCMHIHILTPPMMAAQNVFIPFQQFMPQFTTPPIQDGEDRSAAPRQCATSYDRDCVHSVDDKSYIDKDAETGSKAASSPSFEKDNASAPLARKLNFDSADQSSVVIRQDLGSAVPSQVFLSFLNAAPESWLQQLQINAHCHNLAGFTLIESVALNESEQQDKTEETCPANGAVVPFSGENVAVNGTQEHVAGTEESETGSKTSTGVYWRISADLLEAIIRRRRVKKFTAVRELLPLLPLELVSVWSDGQGYALVTDDTLHENLVLPNYALVQKQALMSQQSISTRKSSSRCPSKSSSPTIVPHLGSTLQELVQSYPQYLQHQYQLYQKQLPLLLQSTQRFPQPVPPPPPPPSAQPSSPQQPVQAPPSSPRQQPQQQAIQYWPPVTMQMPPMGAAFNSLPYCSVNNVSEPAYLSRSSQPALVTPRPSSGAADYASAHFMVPSPHVNTGGVHTSMTTLPTTASQMLSEDSNGRAAGKLPISDVCAVQCGPPMGYKYVVDASGFICVVPVYGPQPLSVYSQPQPQQQQQQQHPPVHSSPYPSALYHTYSPAAVSSEPTTKQSVAAQPPSFPQPCMPLMRPQFVPYQQSPMFCSGMPISGYCQAHSISTRHGIVHGIEPSTSMPTQASSEASSESPTTMSSSGLNGMQTVYPPTALPQAMMILADGQTAPVSNTPTGVFQPTYEYGCTYSSYDPYATYSYGYPNPNMGGSFYPPHNPYNQPAHTYLTQPHPRQPQPPCEDRPTGRAFVDPTGHRKASRNINSFSKGHTSVTSSGAEAHSTDVCKQDTAATIITGGETAFGGADVGMVQAVGESEECAVERVRTDILDKSGSQFIPIHGDVQEPKLNSVNGIKAELKKNANVQRIGTAVESYAGTHKRSSTDSDNLHGVEKQVLNSAAEVRTLEAGGLKAAMSTSLESDASPTHSCSCSISDISSDSPLSSPHRVTSSPTIVRSEADGVCCDHVLPALPAGAHPVTLDQALSLDSTSSTVVSFAIVPTASTDTIETSKYFTSNYCQRSDQTREDATDIPKRVSRHIDIVSGEVPDAIHCGGVDGVAVAQEPIWSTDDTVHQAGSDPITQALPCQEVSRPTVLPCSWKRKSSVTGLKKSAAKPT